MPALASTVRKMEAMTQDENSSLAELGQSVLHDHALTSRILRVANSVSFNLSDTQITTVSRAAVILGFKAIRNICITSKLLENMLKKQKLSEPVYERVLALMARSFHAGMLAKMMTRDRSADEQEEVFIAALLQNVGESAFWSRGGEMTELLDEKLAVSDRSIEEIVRETLGASFHELNCGLAKSWELGDVLLESMETSHSEDPLIQAVNLADELSTALAENDENSQAVKQLVTKAGELMGVEADDAQDAIHQWTEETFSLANAFGASEIKQFISATGNKKQKPKKKRAGVTKSEEQVEQKPSRFAQPDESVQTQILQELVLMATNRESDKKPDFHVIMNTALEGIYRGMGMDRAMVLLVDKQHTFLSPRLVSGEDGEVLKEKFSVSCTCINNFSKALKEQQGCFVLDAQDDFLADNLKPFTPATGFMLAPLRLAGKSIGLFYADRSHSGRKIEQPEFVAFGRFVEQTNLCLSAVMKH